MPFTEKVISATVQMSQQTSTNQPQNFSESGSGSISLNLDGHRVSVRVQNSGGSINSTAQIMIWGMDQSLMNQLSTLGMVLQLAKRNSITVSAGDTNGTSVVFVGTIKWAYGDYNGSPSVPFVFDCIAGLAESVIPMSPSSFGQKTSVVSVLQQIAGKMGWQFENNGVNVTLANPYYAGTAMDQVRQIAEHAQINAVLVNNTLAIWPRYGSRSTSGGTTPMVAPPPQGQMIQYPKVTPEGFIVLRNVFDPNIKLGGQIQVQSSIAQAQGTLNVLKLDLALDSQLPNGKWEQTIWAFNPNTPFPAPPAPP